MATQQTNADGVTYTNYQRDTPEANKQEKRALLAMMAEKGTEGAAEYERNKQLAKDSRASSVEMAAARGSQVHAPSTLQAGIEQDYDEQMAGILANTDAGMLEHAREMDRISSASGSYIDAASAASKLQADMLDKGMLGGGGGGGGGGGRGGGGGGGGGGAPAGFNPMQTLEMAGQAGGLEGPGQGRPLSGTQALFGVDENDEVIPGAGNEIAQNLFVEMKAMHDGGATVEQLGDFLSEAIFQENEAGGTLNPWQLDAAATALSNYFGFTAEPVPVGTYFPEGGDANFTDNGEGGADYASLRASGGLMGDPTLSNYTEKGRDSAEAQELALLLARGDSSARYGREIKDNRDANTARAAAQELMRMRAEQEIARTGSANAVRGRPDPNVLTWKPNAGAADTRQRNAAFAAREKQQAAARKFAAARAKIAARAKKKNPNRGSNVK